MNKLGASLLIGGLVVVAASVTALAFSWAGYHFDLGTDSESTYLAGAGLIGFVSTLVGVSRCDPRPSAH